MEEDRDVHLGADGTRGTSCVATEVLRLGIRSGILRTTLGDSAVWKRC